MTKRDYFLLFLLALIISVGFTSVQSTPGYMDAHYYYATGVQLAQGKGFTEPFLWNYLDNAKSLPHPSHAYWMPLASIFAAFGMWVTRGFGFASAKLAFILLSALVPVITARLAFYLSEKRYSSIISALLAMFSGYYALFLTTTDSVSIYMVLGGLFFLALTIQKTWLKAISLGFIAALFHLSRADGAIWLIFAILSFQLSIFNIALRLSTANAPFTILKSQFLRENLKFLPPLLLAYFSLMLPWFLRNYAAFGTVLAPNGDQMLWQTSYNQIFTYPVGNLSVETWLASGWDEIIKTRLWSLKQNLGTIVAVQGGILSFPFIIIGVWVQLKKSVNSAVKKEIVIVGIFAWLTTFAIMTLAFPFAGARGSFAHSGAALQPLWWAIAPLGLDSAIFWIAKKRKWKAQEARQIFSVALVIISLLLTVGLLWWRVLSVSARTQAQNKGVPLYSSVERVILSHGNPSLQEAIIVANPPAYFLASERFALALPDGDIQTILAIAKRYNAKYLVLESGAVTSGLMPIFDAPMAYPDLILLDEIKGAKIFVIKTE